ncbi:Rpn family recombination-promoting nuclease/putative transposase [Azomonas macrocytogenes]|uniref:Putative transposase/invertase (TIGR01784 family) n=1 Tax=Azomonas macrocytogenes TaxID=69962 RepID=A0A839SWX9_AZOMA|nr:Rpn family recombination-promoting nuclease/putative transposase [Azomonas macrocytogenes]MBB3101887.1 putative transposase/invertase (TIGR01784 family) [Azomonas macrocytogenes]
MLQLLDPKNDFVFKRLFADSPELLADLINAVRSDEPPIEIVEVLNPRIDPAELHGKFIVLDVLARDEHGRFYNIEMQVRRHADWIPRSTYYLARTLANQLKTGDDYGTLKPVIGIHLLDFELYEHTQAHWCFELRDRLCPEVALGNALQLHLIELPKADRLHSGQTRLANWITYFEHWQEDSIMSNVTHEPVRQAMQQLEQLSSDEEAKRLAFVRERALRDEISELKAARKEGLEQGLEKGRQQLVATVQRQLTRRFGPLPEVVQERLAQADTVQLERWADRLLDAASLEEVFQAS